MPIFEFRCNLCDHKFSKLVKSGSDEIECPNCKSDNVKKLFSSFASAGNAKSSGSSCGKGGFT